MSNVLVVSYTPRTGSNTQKLLDSYLACLPKNTEIDFLDLLNVPVNQHGKENIDALLKRNFANLPLNSDEQVAVKDADDYMERLLDCDRVVFAFPLYNFSVPAAIKAWVDAVIQKGRTFDISEEGAYVGLCTGKKALVLMSSGGDYNDQSMSAMNLATPLMKICLGFMGIDTHAISAFGLDQYPEKSEDIVAATQREIVDYASSQAYP